MNSHLIKIVINFTFLAAIMIPAATFSQQVSDDFYFPVPADAGDVVKSDDLSFSVDHVVEGVDVQWGMAFLPDGRILITERSGALHITKNGKLQDQPVSGVPEVAARDQGGLLDIELHPDYENNGWPEITYGINYNGSIITEDTEKPGMEQPLHYWDPSIAPSGMDFVWSDKYPNWKGDLMVGSLSFQYLHRVKLSGHDVLHEEELLKGIGRVRSIHMAPDGFLYEGVENLGIIRLLPVN